MKVGLTVKSIAAGMLFLCSQLAALADPLTITPTAPLSGATSGGSGSAASNKAISTMEGAVPLEKLGGVLLPDGQLKLSGNSVDVSIIPNWHFDRRKVFRGTVLQASYFTAGNQIVVKGLAYFNGGAWLHYIEDVRALDTIITGTGDIVGHIVAINSDANTITVETDNKQGNGTVKQDVSLSDIAGIRSSKAYAFTIPLALTAQNSSLPSAGQPFQADATRIMLNPTTKQVYLASIQKDKVFESDHDLRPRTLAMIGAGLTLLETAQMLPVLLVPLSAGAFRRNERNQINLYGQQTNFQTATGTLYPLGTN